MSMEMKKLNDNRDKMVCYQKVNCEERRLRTKQEMVHRILAQGKSLMDKGAKSTFILQVFVLGILLTI